MDGQPGVRLEYASRCVVLGVLATSFLTSCGPGTAKGQTNSAPTTRSQALALEERIAACQGDARVLAQLVSVDVCVGADLFFRETFNGNGRTCASCHPAENNFTLDPAFIATLPSNAPLFVAEHNPSLVNLERPEQMRAYGLILENADGFDPDPNVRFVLRSVPHTLSLGTSVSRAPGAPSPPEDRTGWSGDGAHNPGRLRDFQTGAIIQHYTNSLTRVVGTDFRLATDDELDRIDLFLRQLGRTNELDLSATKMGDSGAEAGRLTFLSPESRCNRCHGNAGANASFGGGGNRNFNTGVELARIAALAGFPRDGGFRATPLNPDGSFGDGTFNTPPLIEAADTGPFFHTATTVSGAPAHNAAVANTIEEAIAFYNSPAFNSSPAAAAGQIHLSEAEINNLGRFLRVLNAAFNIQLAKARLEAALKLADAFEDQQLEIQMRLVELAGVEVDDAIEVLTGVSRLNNGARSQLQGAQALMRNAINSPNRTARKAMVNETLNRIAKASNDLGHGLTFAIGEGTIMF